MTDTANRRTQYSSKNHEYWDDQIKLKQASGLSRAAYCRLHGIVCSRFSYWENKLTQANSESLKLLPVRLNSDTSSCVSADIIRCAFSLKSGHELKVYDHSVLPLLLSLLS